MKNGDILLTGATSFTGCYIARALADAGFSVHATLTGRRGDREAEALIKKRLEWARVSEWTEEAPFGSDNFLATLKKKSFRFFVNHGASIKGYRSPDFDYLGCLKSSTHNIEKVVELLKQAGVERVLHSGSIFESDEGQDPFGALLSAPAVSIYGVTKKLTWEVLRFYCERAELPLSKVIIPNPIGPFENVDRMFPFFAKLWLEGKVPEFRSPDLMRDNIPASWLAHFYVREALAPRDENTRILRPSGFVMRNEDFLNLFKKHYAKMGSRKLEVNIHPQPSAEPLERFNIQAAPELRDPDKIESFFRSWFSDLSLL